MKRRNNIVDRLFDLLRYHADQGDAEAHDLLQAMSCPEKYAAKPVRRRGGAKVRRPYKLTSSHSPKPAPSAA